MSVMLKDDLIKACVNAYRTASGTTDGVKAGELAEKIAALTAGGGASNLYIGEYTPSEDVSSIDVVHGLGTRNIFIAVIAAQSFEGATLSANRCSSQCYIDTAYPQYVSSTFTLDRGIVSNMTYYYSNKYSRVVSTTADSTTEIVDGNTVRFKPTAAFAMGVTYKAVIVTAEEVSA